MKILVDTHILIWLFTTPARVRESEWALISHDQSEVLISVVSLWEIRMKWDAFVRRGGGEKVLDPIAAVEFINDAGFAIAPLTSDVILAPLDPPIDHHDPFDRILLVHAHQLGARLLTRDDKLQVHPIGLRA